jgi:hypothetical protein
MVVTIAVADGREDDYRSWHDRHLAEVVAHVPGVVAARRYELSDPGAVAGAFPTARFVAAYALRDEPERVRADLEAARAGGHISAPPDGVVEGALTLQYDAAADPVTAG